MTQRNQNVKVYRGNTAVLNVTVTQADGSPYDPALGAQFRYRVATSPKATDEEAVILKTFDDGSINQTPTGVEIFLNPEDTSDLDDGIYYHELKVWDTGDGILDVSTAMVGAFILKGSMRMGDAVSPSSNDLILSATVPTRSP